MSNPNTFEESLKRQDPQLRLRWGNVIGCWIVERDCRIEPDLRLTLQYRGRRAQTLLGNPSVPEKRRDELRKEVEEGASAARGRRIVVWTHALDNRVFNALWQSDLQRHGIDRFDLAQARDEKARDKKHHDELEDISREVEEVTWWARGKKSAEIEGGKAIPIVAEAFKRPYFKGQPYSLPAPKRAKSLLDAFGRPV